MNSLICLITRVSWFQKLLLPVAAVIPHSALEKKRPCEAVMNPMDRGSFAQPIIYLLFSLILIYLKLALQNFMNKSWNSSCF